MVSNLMISAKLATPGFLKTKLFWNKDLSCESNYIVDVAMWSKVGNCIISMKKVITTSIL